MSSFHSTSESKNPFSRPGYFSHFSRRNATLTVYSSTVELYCSELKIENWNETGEKTVPERYGVNGVIPVIRLDLETLAADPGDFRMSFGFDLEPLATSIDAAGLLNQPLVWQQEGRVHVVSGYRRVLALRKLGMSVVECRLIPESTSRNRCMLLNFHDNIATRPLNQVEKAMACARLLSLFPRREVIERYMPVLGLPSHDKTLELYLAIDAEPNGEIKQALASGQMSLKAAAALLNMAAPAKKVFFDLFARVRFNLNQQTQIIDMLCDIADITGKNLSLVMKEKELTRILDNRTANQPQKARAVLDYCRQKRYPSLHAAENRFRSIVGRLGLPSEVSILHPEYFEASDFRMEVKFKNGTHLKELLTRLNRLPLETLGNPWKNGDNGPA